MRFKHYFIKALVFLLLTGAAALPSDGTEKKSAGQQYLTKGDVIQLLAASEAMKKKISALFSWKEGYDRSKINRGGLTPTINFVDLVPRKVPPDGKTVLEIIAEISDPGGLGNIAGVRADLSAIGRLPNAAMADSGRFGDKKAGDGLFTLQTNVSPKVNQGDKDIQISAANKKGWLALARATLEVRRNPIILSAGCQPEKVLADGKTLVTITVKVDNPGRVEDVRSVTANLWAFGLSDRTPLRNDGWEGDATGGDDIWTVQFVVPSNAVPGNYSVPLEVTNQAGGIATGTIAVTVIK
jgi:hypothetical protein